MRKSKAIEIKRIISIALVIGILLPSVVVMPAQATSLSYGLVDIHTAYSLITSNQQPKPILLDVRSECEYKLSHLYDAISIPFGQLESRINELEDSEIIVYCKTGRTSQMAAEILVIHGFTSVNSLIGGIVAWLDVGYPVWAASHYISMGTGNSFTSEPLLAFLGNTTLPSSDCTTCQDFNMTNDVDRIIIEEDYSHSVECFTLNFNDTLIEAIVTTAKIWEFSETSESMNESAAFVSYEVAIQDLEVSAYGLHYSIQHMEYTFSLQTVLSPLDSNSYNNSMTVVTFKPTENPADIVSLEAIEFEGSRNISAMYRDISFIVKKIGAEYLHASDEYLNTLGYRYDLIQNHIKDFSKLVEKELPNYDLEIEKSAAILFDPCDLGCWGLQFHDCLGIIGPTTLTCLLAGVLICQYSGPLFGVCIGPFIYACGIIDFALAVFCAIEAYIECCWDTGGGGGGCPILSVSNGIEYTSEGLLAIHAESDIIRTFFLQTTPVPLNNQYLLKLTEHPQTRSHLDEIRLFARISDGYIIEIPLVAAIHMEEGDVLFQLSYSDDIRIDELGADHNNGTSEYIDLYFAVPEGFECLQFMIVLEGYNVDEKQ